MAFDPKLGAYWRWYADDAAVPTGALAVESATWNPTSDYLNHTPARLRFQIRENGSEAGTLGTLTVEYSYDQTNWFAAGVLPTNQGTRQSSQLMHYQYGKSTAGGSVTTNLLTNSLVNGINLHGSAGGGTLGSDSVKEFDWSFALNWPPPDSKIYLRILNATIPFIADDTFPSFEILKAQRMFAITNVPYLSNGDTAEADWGQSAWPRAFNDQYDNVWVFCHLNNDVDGVHYWLRSNATGSFSETKTLTISGSPNLDAAGNFNRPRTSSYMKDFQDRSVVGVCAVPTTGNPKYRRGYCTSGDTDFTWNDEQDLGANFGLPVQVVIDQGGRHWLITGLADTIRTRVSTGADDGSASWTPTFSSNQDYTSAGVVAGSVWVAATPISENRLLIIYTHNDGQLRSIDVSGSTYSGAATSIETGVGGGDVGVCAGTTKCHLVYAKDNGTGDRLRYHKVYDIENKTWSDGPTMDTSDASSHRAWNDGSQDGIAVVAGSGNNCYAFGVNGDRQNVGTERHVDGQFYDATNNQWSCWNGLVPQQRGNADLITCGVPVERNGKVSVLFNHGEQVSRGYVPTTEEYVEWTVPKILEFGSERIQGTSGNISITKPANVIENDLVLVVIHANVADNTITNTNSTSIFTESIQENTVDSSRYYIGYRIATSGEESSYTWGFNSSQAYSAVLRVFRGVDIDNPWIVSPSTGSRNTVTGGVYSINGPGFTTTRSNSLALLLAISDTNSSWIFNSPGFYNSDLTNSPVTAAAGQVLHTWHRNIISAGTVPDQILRVAGTAYDVVLHQVALQPESLLDAPILTAEQVGLNIEITWA